MMKTIVRAFSPLALAGAAALIAVGVAGANPGTDDGIYPPPAPPIVVDPDGPGTDDGIYPLPAPPIRVPL